MVFRHAGTAGEDCSDYRRLIKSDNSLSWSMAIAARGTEEEDRQASESRWL
jgi:hypothetical protein